MRFFKDAEFENEIQNEKFRPFVEPHFHISKIQNWTRLRCFVGSFEGRILLRIKFLI